MKLSGDEKSVKLGAIGELKGFIKEMLANHMAGKKPKEVSVEVEAAGPVGKESCEDDEKMDEGMLEKLMEMANK
jgi:hypothetical protein